MPNHGIYDSYIPWLGIYMAFIWKVCNITYFMLSSGEYTIYSLSVPWYSPRVNKSYIHLKGMKYLLYIALCVHFWELHSLSSHTSTHFFYKILFLFSTEPLLVLELWAFSYFDDVIAWLLGKVVLSNLS